ncbi:MULTISPECIES: TfoX/Sxy family protein [unclassified Frankia]|uniref:TfoX/Sxy family protein n=1 Tax=unclassified Frankia TaxID=2632575 RepID=UPI002AD21172|nr:MULTISPECIES: TfoX/Sxy family protein [unclassified Frankia]
MSGDRSLADHILDQLQPIDGVTLRRFFGGWALCHHDRQFAMVMDTLYLRVDAAAGAAAEAAGAHPFTYRAAGRTVTVRRYYSVPDDVLDNRESLCALVLNAIEPTRTGTGTGTGTQPQFLRSQ